MGKVIKNQLITERFIKKFMVKQLYNKCTSELCTHLHEGGKSGLYNLASSADQYTTVHNLVAGQHMLNEAATRAPAE